MFMAEVVCANFVLRSKVAIKMSKSAGKGKDSIEDVETDSDVSSEEEDDARGPGREETPDLYRNSALGIYGGVSKVMIGVDPH